MNYSYTLGGCINYVSQNYSGNVNTRYVNLLCMSEYFGNIPTHTVRVWLYIQEDFGVYLHTVCVF